MQCFLYILLDQVHFSNYLALCSKTFSREQKNSTKTEGALIELSACQFTLEALSCHKWIPQSDQMIVQIGVCLFKGVLGILLVLNGNFIQSYSKNLSKVLCTAAFLILAFYTRLKVFVITFLIATSFLSLLNHPPVKTV